MVPQKLIILPQKLIIYPQKVIIVPQSQIINSHIGFCGILIIFWERVIIMIINCHQGQHSHFPSTTLLENLVFPFRFRTNLRSKLSISYSASKKLPTRRSISSVGSGAERTAMNVPKGEPGGNRKTTFPRVKKHLCLCTRCEKEQRSSSQNAFEV